MENHQGQAGLEQHCTQVLELAGRYGGTRELSPPIGNNIIPIFFKPMSSRPAGKGRRWSSQRPWRRVPGRRKADRRGTLLDGEPARRGIRAGGWGLAVMGLVNTAEQTGGKVRA